MTTSPIQSIHCLNGLLRWTKCERANKKLYFHDCFWGEREKMKTFLFSCFYLFFAGEKIKKRFIFTPVCCNGPSVNEQIKKLFYFHNRILGEKIYFFYFPTFFAGEKIKNFLISLPFIGERKLKNVIFTAVFAGRENKKLYSNSRFLGRENNKTFLFSLPFIGERK